ncbi:MAG: SRPBCC family protein [Myxococcota bacterium]
MRILRTIALGLAVAVGALALFIATRPAEFKIERSATIAAPPDAVFALVNDFHQWDAWSPYAHLDPSMKTSYTGATSGVGAAYGWSGDDKVGEGKMTILDSTPGEKIAIELEFMRPMAAKNLATFKFVPIGGSTQVTWAMEGRNGFMGKAFGLLVNMDQLVGSDFAKGLAALKALAEAAR